MRLSDELYSVKFRKNSLELFTHCWATIIAIIGLCRYVNVCVCVYSSIFKFNNLLSSRNDLYNQKQQRGRRVIGFVRSQRNIV